MRRDTYAFLQKKVPQLGSLFSFLCERKIDIQEIPPGSDSIGYTKKGKTIFVSYKNDFTENLSKENALSFCSGVSVHEFAHQYFTNFDEHKRRIESLPSEERAVYGEIANIVEDARIENFVPGVVSRAVAKTLEYSISHIYKTAPNIEEAQTPYAQFGSAMIQFGDEGILKGRFTFDEAFETFKKVAPIFNKAAVEPDGKKVFDYVDEIFEISRPLWEGDVQAQKELAQLLSDLMKGDADGDGEGHEAPSWSNNSKKEERREQTSKQISSMPRPSENNKEEAKENGASPSPKSDDKKESGDESQASEKGKKENEGSDESNSGNASDESNNSEGSQGSSESKSDSSSKAEKNISNASKSEQSKKSNNTSSDKSSQNDADGSQGSISSVSPENSELSEEEMEELKQLLESAEKPDESPEEIDELPPDKLTSIGRVPQIRNIRPAIKPGYVEEYKIIFSSMRSKIAVVSKELQRIFDEDVDKKIYRATGKISMKRVSEKKQTPNLFTKRRLPGDKKDIAIAIAVDNSGSMNGKKIEEAKRLCVAFAEIFGKLNVPLYIMGFTTGIGNELIHEHYIQWKNSVSFRPGLCDIASHNCNGDSVAIRYLKGILEKRPESRKMLIVISDGMPSAGFYGSGINGLSDTVKAVKETQKSMNVLGVALGLSETEKKAFKEMYGNDYIFCQKAEQLFSSLTKKVKTIINK